MAKILNPPMDDSYFLREGVVDIDAAVVGISKWRWVSVSQSTSKPEALKIMRQKRFDILPIETKDSSVRYYFRATHWGNYSSIMQEKTTHRDVVPLHTHVRDILRGFALENRTFYFLTNDDRIVGLISIVNFNCRQVKTYLFSLISEFEVRLGEFLSARVKEEEIVETVLKHGQHASRSRVQKHFEKDRAAGVDVPLVEYLYLSQLFEVVNAKKLYGLFDCDSPELFSGRYSSIKKLRNQVAHPTKSLITEPNSCRDLWTTIDIIEEALFMLRHLSDPPS